jgi:hypothetical protein
MMRSVNGSCGCRVDSIMGDGQHEDIVALACADHRVSTKGGPLNLIPTVTSSRRFLTTNSSVV